MPLPETDLHRIHLWARERGPEHLWPELKVEAEVADRHVDIRRSAPQLDWQGRPDPLPDRSASYTKSSGQRSIYWRDRHLKFHECKRKRPSKNIQSLLDYSENSGDPIFWG